MPTIEQNLKEWNDSYDWSKDGDEWSKSWGGTEGLWWWVLFPRIHRFLNVNTILEIAPGYGRFTNYLKDFCKKLIVVDLSPKCIEACKVRFKDSTNIDYYTTDGKSLEMIKENDIDFIFSFDSLVHAEKDVIESYVAQLGSKMSKDGVACIHHSNLGSYKTLFSKSISLKPPFLIKSHWRAKSMSADLFKKYCENSGLNCINQELVNWGNHHLTDCISIVTPKESKFYRKNLITKNYDFMNEAKYVSNFSESYKI